MDAKELAQLLNGRQYGSEITKEEAKQAKESNLVVVFGYSDDGVAFQGAIDDEDGCYDGGTVLLTKKGILRSECNDGDCPYFKEMEEKAKRLEIIWDDENYPTWSYRTDIPHETFDIIEDDEVFCKGIVFSLDDLGGY